VILFGAQGKTTAPRLLTGALEGEITNASSAVSWSPRSQPACRSLH